MKLHTDEGDKMPHFFINSQDIKNNIIEISDKETFSHLVNSLRIKTGEKLLFIDENEIQYETIVENINKKSLCSVILKKYKSKRKLNYEIYLAQSILKTERQLLAIQNATELGVKKIFPILSDNCTIKKESLKNKREKWQKIAFESSKQCERADIPQISEILNIEDILKLDATIIIMGEKEATISIKEFFKNKKYNNEKIIIVIGPEGGFSEKEFHLFKEKNIPILTLGNLILRADTAISVALGNIIQELT